MKPKDQEHPMSYSPVSAHDWPEDFGHENGAYMNVCVECKVTFIGYKRRLLCKVCVLKQGPVLGPKPEGKLW